MVVGTMDFKTELTERVDYINKVLAGALPAEEGMQKRVIEAANYSVNAGGKRIRPMIMLETYRLFNGTDEKLLEPYMAAMECIHTYSLVHDDLPAMDDDAYRRGQLTTHKKYGEDFGILAGDALLNYAYELMINGLAQIKDGDTLIRAVKAAQILSAKAGIYGMVGGQSLDVWLTNKPMSAEQLEFIFNLKTGALIEASFMIGATLAGADQEAVMAMEKAGNDVGVAFQIQDDILDLISSQDVLGKPVKSDMKNNKETYVSLYGIEKSREDVRVLSENAINAIKKHGNNEFLTELVEALINREK